MGGRHAGLFAGAVLALVASCTFGIDTSGLTGDGDRDGGRILDAQADAAIDVRSIDAPRDHRDVSPGVDAKDENAQTEASPGKDAGSDAPELPCDISSVQAVPGTAVYQVMQNSATSSQALNLTTGNLLVAIAYGGQGPGQSTPLTTVPNMTFSIRDSLGNAFYGGPMFENSNSHQASIQIFYSPNVIGGADSVTASSADANGISLWTGLLLQEYSGLATVDVVDVSSGQMAPSSTSTITPGSMTTVSRCDLVVGAFTDGHVGGQNLGSGTGWVLRSTDDWDPGGAVDNAPLGAPAGSSVNAVMNLTGGADNGWVASQMAFRGAPTPALSQPSEIAFSTPPRSISEGVCSSVVTLESRRASVATNTATGMSIALSGTGLTFYADANCAYPISSLYLGAGTSARSFYFVSSATGVVTLKASVGSAMSTSQVETVH
jgi:hypothetical protein